MADWIVLDGDDVLIAVHAVPGARRSEIVGMHGDRLRVKVAAPPQEGRANRALEMLLADALGAPVAVVRGHGSRLKTVRAAATTPDDVRIRLGIA